MNTPAEPDVPSDPALAAIYAVDDEEIDRAMLERALRAAGVRNPCRLFENGGALLDALLDVLRGAPLPLLCFIDVKMAGMGGLDVLRWIRAQSALREVPIVMLSSSEEPQYLAQALCFGAQCYVAKFPPAEQLREIVAAAERHAAESSTGTFHLPCNLLIAATEPATATRH